MADDRHFIHAGQAWYAETNQWLRPGINDEVYFGTREAEFAIRWRTLGDKSVPQLQVYDDGWAALLEFADLFELLAALDDQYVTPTDLCERLVSLGIEDRTPRTRPKDANAPEETKTASEILEDWQACSAEYVSDIVLAADSNNSKQRWVFRAAAAVLSVAHAGQLIAAKEAENA
jgi:hypothetical protein